jgi:hypothetical protein
LDPKDTFFSEIKSPKLLGIPPVSALEERLRLSRFSRSVMELGILPLSPLPEKSMWVRLKSRCFGM